MHLRLLAVLLVLSFGVAACGGSQPAPAPATQEPAAARPRPLTRPSAATVAGKINLEGTPPANAPIRMNADPACVAANKGHDADAGNLRQRRRRPRQRVRLRAERPERHVPGADDAGRASIRRAAGIIPHVFGVQVGQPIEILNSDATLHNIHATPKTNAEFNTAQPIQGMKTTHTFTAKEADVVVPFKCDVHGWMNAYAGVLDHPYFAVTKPDGSFSIPNLPPGTLHARRVAREARHADAAA